MTEQEIKNFRDEFASVVYWKGMVKAKAADIRTLEHWNKGGSHDEAIKRNIQQLNEYRAKLKEKLKGKSYDEWREFSARLSKLKNKVKQAVNDSTKSKWRTEIEKAQFN